MKPPTILIRTKISDGSYRKEAAVDAIEKDVVREFVLTSGFKVGVTKYYWGCLINLLVII